MSDPIEDVLNQLRQKPGVQKQHFSSNFLNNVGDVLEREGFATTKLFLQGKQEQSATRYVARVLLEEVLPVLESCERIRQNRAIGRLIIKSLPTIQTDRGGRR